LPTVWLMCSGIDSQHVLYCNKSRSCHKETTQRTVSWNLVNFWTAVRKKLHLERHAVGKWPSRSLKVIRIAAFWWAIFTSLTISGL